MAQRVGVNVLDEFAARQGLAQSQRPIMTDSGPPVKVEVNDRYLWPTRSLTTRIFDRQRQPPSGEGARAQCSKRPASLRAEDEAVPLGGVLAVVLAKSPDHYAGDENILHTAGDLIAAHQVSSRA